MKKKRRVRNKVKTLNIYVFAILIGLSISYLLSIYYIPRDEFTYEILPEPPRRGYHAHADFLVILNEQPLNFMKPEYDAVDPRIHLHLPNFMGDKVIHVESKNATIGDFFSSLDMNFNSTCFSSNDVDYCNNSTHFISFYINGRKSEEYENFKIKDLDRLLITYGNGQEISRQIDSVTSFSCIFSGVCEAPPEAENKIIFN